LQVDWRPLAAATLCTFIYLQPGALMAQERAFAPVQKPDDIVTGAIARSHAANLGIKQSRTDVVEFLAGPFPYDGKVPGTGRSFIVDEDGKRQHISARGRAFSENTFNDQRTLMHIPQGFNIKKPGVIVVFFHGHGAELNRDVLRRQQVPAQISQSYSNAVLLAPQFALDASDSSAGNFWKPGGFGPTAAVIKNGGIGKRLHGVVMLDSLYADLDTFKHWISANRSAFFVSAYLGSTKRQNLELKQELRDQNVAVSDSLSSRIKPGTVAFVAGDPSEERHRDFVTQAWTDAPIADVLNRLAEYRR
jgi:hypothetical protein